MESQSMIYIVSEFACQGEIFGKLLPESENWMVLYGAFL